jgi:ribulose-phosphate 3-epimerase
MSEIIPAILPKSTEELQRKLTLIPEQIPLIHIDVVDSSVYFDPTIDFEVHFMIPDPDTVVDEWVQAGAKRVITHKLTDKIKSLRPGVKVGLGIELNTNLSEASKLFSEVDFVQLMAIKEIGEQGHTFEPEIFGRIKWITDNFPGLLIAVDGGVNLGNADDLLASGVDRLVVGSAIFSTQNPLDEFIKFLEVAK